MRVCNLIISSIVQAEDLRMTISSPRVAPTPSPNETRRQCLEELIITLDLSIGNEGN